MTFYAMAAEHFRQHIKTKHPAATLSHLAVAQAMGGFFPLQRNQPFFHHVFGFVGLTTISIAFIAKQAGISRRQANRALNWLEERREVLRDPGGDRKPNGYGRTLNRYRIPCLENERFIPDERYMPPPSWDDNEWAAWKAEARKMQLQHFVKIRQRRQAQGRRVYKEPTP